MSMTYSRPLKSWRVAGGVTLAIIGCLSTTIAAQASNQVTAGGSSSTFAPTLTVAASGPWVIVNSSGSTVASYMGTNGWTVSVSYSPSYTVQTFTVTAPSTAAVGANYQVSATSSSGANAAQFDVVAGALAISGVSVNPATAIGATAGSTATTGTVTLNQAAPAGGTLVTLTSSNTSAATVPASVTVPAGATSATFAVTPQHVSASTAVTISGTFNSVTKTASLTVNPWIKTLTLSSPTAVAGGAVETGTVTLNAAAPTGGIVVNLTSSNTSAATVPASVTVPAGSTSAAFTITPQTVTSAASTTISAAYDGVTQTAGLTVNPWLKTLSLAASTITGGSSTTGTVSLNQPAPAGGIVVAVASSNTSAATVAVSSVTIPANSSSATFTINGAAVTAPATTSITASNGGVVLSQSLTVQPLLASITLNPASVVGGGNYTGTVTLNSAAPAGGAVISLTATNAAVGSVPASVTVPAGSTSASFPVTTTVVASATGVTLSAAYAGVTKTAVLTVNPNPANAPTNVKATSGDQQILLTWNPVAGATAYKVYRSNSSGTGYSAISLANPAANAAIDSGLDTAAKYYVVTATVGGVESAYSAQVTGASVSQLANWTVTPPSGASTPAPTTSGIASTMSASVGSTLMASANVTGATTATVPAQTSAQCSGTWTFTWTGTNWPTLYVVKHIAKQLYLASVVSGTGSSTVSVTGGSVLVSAAYPVVGTPITTTPATTLSFNTSDLTAPVLTTALTSHVAGDVPAAGGGTSSAGWSETINNTTISQLAYTSAWFQAHYANPQSIVLTFTVPVSDITVSSSLSNSTSIGGATASASVNDLYQGS